MNVKTGIVVAFLAGTAVGAVGVALAAAGTAPVYVVTDFSEISDKDGFKAAAKTVPDAIKAAGGAILVRTDTAVALDGPVPVRFAMFSFPTLDAAKAWYSSDAMKDAQAGRAKFTKSRSFIVEGLAN